jgi:DNA-binding NtrC family response regulator
MTAATIGPILLIDDDELIAGSLCHYLRAQGRSVDVALEPVSAAEWMERRRYDVIVVDPYLTGSIHGSGILLIAAVRAYQPDSSILVLTGYASPTLLELASADPRTTVLYKPQSIPLLGEAIHRIPISRSKAEAL